MADHGPPVGRTTRRRGALLDWLILSLLAAAACGLAWRLGVGLNYQWNWGIIPTYLLRFDPEQGRWLPGLLLQGLITTIRLSLWAMLLATLLGLVMGVVRTRRRLLGRMIGFSYVELIRNIPPLVLVFIFYFFVSDRLLPLLGVEGWLRALPPTAEFWLALFCGPKELLLPFFSGVITVALFQGAYITEIVRAGIQAIPAGQWESAASLGLTSGQQLRLVILPQALRQVLPPLANELINTVKYSSIVSVISIQELTFQGLQVMASTQVTIEVWLTISLMYLGLCLAISLGVHYLETRLARSYQ